MIVYIFEHLNDFWPGLIMCLITGLVMANCPRGRKVIEPFAATRLGRCIVGLLVGGILMCGWTKGPVSIGSVKAQFITALSGGGIVDGSGLVVTSTEEETVAAFADLTVEIASAASQTVVDASDDFAEVATLVTNTERKVIYIQSTLPRTDPTQGLTNHNISAFVMRTSMSADQAVISRYVWYSAAPLVGPAVVCVVDVGGGDTTLSEVTNTFPDTVEIDGIDCVRYDYAVPEGLRNVVFWPDQEFTFGSDDNPLEVGIDGVSVDVGEDTSLPFSGTDSYFTGRVDVVYSGGIATKVYIDGAAVTNGVYEL